MYNLMYTTILLQHNHNTYVHLYNVQYCIRTNTEYKDTTSPFLVDKATTVQWQF